MGGWVDSYGNELVGKRIEEFEGKGQAGFHERGERFGPLPGIGSAIFILLIVLLFLVFCLAGSWDCYGC